MVTEEMGRCGNTGNTCGGCGLQGGGGGSRSCGFCNLMDIMLEKVFGCKICLWELVVMSHCNVMER